MKIRPTAIEALTNIGFSEYEAKAYLALLMHQPETPYEMAKKSGIPTSKIYEVVRKLAEKGYILPVTDNEDGRLYAAMETDELASKETQKIVQSLETVSKTIADEKAKSNEHYIWPLATSEEALAKAGQMIETAERELLIAMWREESISLLPHIRQASARGVRIAVIHYGEHQIEDIGPVYRHPIENTIYEEKGGRILNIVADREQSLTATFWTNGQVEGGWTRNKAFVTVTEDYIRHDIYVLKIEQRLEPKITDWSSLRNVFTDS
ncbi:TrmB family transcriptional regulator [Paenibacillus caui]|uniref:TrmB family transcriptional regulator n=1 Tax=Paenibacillus caui TaxID=2873927 RepID=UPI001CA90694|nr:TrmB family transcriptional regulator [Paenibacillus caui]